MCCGGCWGRGSNFGAACKTVHSWTGRQLLLGQAMDSLWSEHLRVLLMDHFYQFCGTQTAWAETARMFNEIQPIAVQTVEPEAAVLGASLKTIWQEESMPIVFACKHFNDKFPSLKIICEQWITSWRPSPCCSMLTERPTSQTNPWCSWMTKIHIGQYLGWPPSNGTRNKALQNHGLPQCWKRAFPKTRGCMRRPTMSEPDQGHHFAWLAFENCIARPKFNSCPWGRSRHEVDIAAREEHDCNALHENNSSTSKCIVVLLLRIA